MLANVQPFKNRHSVTFDGADQSKTDAPAHGIVRDLIFFLYLLRGLTVLTCFRSLAQ